MDEISFNFENMKLHELKSQCRQFKLKMTGKKDDLVNRIQKFLFFVRKKIKDKYTIFGKGSEKCKMKESEKFIPSDNVKDMYQSLTSFQKYYFLFDPNKQAITKKIHCRKEQISELTREDIQYLECINLPYEIPILLLGEPNRYRDISKEENEEDFFENCNEEDF